MTTFKLLADVVLIGLALAILFYWTAILIGRINSAKEYFKWWIKVIIIQGIVLASAIKIVGLL